MENIIAGNPSQESQASFKNGLPVASKAKNNEIFLS